MQPNSTKKKILVVLRIITLFLVFLLFTRFIGETRKITRTPINQKFSVFSAEPIVTTPLRLLFVGDVMLGRHVETLMRSNPDRPFERIGDFLQTWDAVIGNLEGTVVADKPQTPLDSARFAFKPAVAGLLKKNNITIVSRGNNHTYDYGAEGFREMAAHLDEAGVVFFGHPTRIDADEVLVRTMRNREFVFLSFNETLRNLFDLTEAKALALAERGKHPDAFLITAIQWGDEYRTTSSPRQQEIARALIDAGADVIIGHHPHVTQEIEAYKGKPIFYSLGNFIFDQYFSPEVQEGLAIGIEVGERQGAYHIFPILGNRSQPIVAEGAERTRILKGLAEHSDPTLAADIRAGALSFGGND